MCPAPEHSKPHLAGKNNTAAESKQNDVLRRRKNEFPNLKSKQEVSKEVPELPLGPS